MAILGSCWTLFLFRTTNARFFAMLRLDHKYPLLMVMLSYVSSKEKLKRPLVITGWCSGRGFVFNVEMFEIAGYFTAVGDGCKSIHVAFAVLTLSHIDFESFSEHFARA